MRYSVRNSSYGIMRTMPCAAFAGWKLCMVRKIQQKYAIKCLNLFTDNNMEDEFICIMCNRKFMPNDEHVLVRCFTNCSIFWMCRWCAVEYEQYTNNGMERDEIRKVVYGQE